MRSTDPRQAIADFQVVQRSAFVDEIHHAVGRWLERIGEVLVDLGERIEGEPAMYERRRRHLRKLTTLDRSRILVAGGVPGTPAIRGVRLAPRETATVSFTIQVPPNADPGDRYRLDVIQRQGQTIIGGSTYVIAVTDARGRL